MTTHGQVKIEGAGLPPVFFSIGSDAYMLYEIVTDALTGRKDGFAAFLGSRMVTENWIDGVSNKLDTYNTEYLVVVNLDERTIQEFTGWNIDTGPTELGRETRF